MGAWGLRLTDDDLAADIVGEFFERFDKGEEPKVIREALETSNSSSIKDSDEGHIFWLALAKAQWDIGVLDNDVLHKVLEIVESDIDTRVWIDLDGDRPEKRRQSIIAFSKQIQTPREKPRKRKKKIPKSSPFEVGDVLVFKTSDDDWGACVVGEAEKDTRFGFTGIVDLDVKQRIEPSLQQILQSNILVCNDPNWKEPKIHSCRLYAEHRKIAYEPFKVIGRLKVKKLNPPFGEYSTYGWWRNTIGFFEGGHKRKALKKYSLKKYLGYLPLQKISIV